MARRARDEEAEQQLPSKRGEWGLTSAATEEAVIAGLRKLREAVESMNFDQLVQAREKAEAAAVIARYRGLDRAVKEAVLTRLVMEAGLGSTLPSADDAVRWGADGSPEPDAAASGSTVGSAFTKSYRAYFRRVAAAKDFIDSYAKACEEVGKELSREGLFRFAREALRAIDPPPPPVAPAGSNVPVPAPAPVIDRDELDRLGAEEQAEQEALDAAGIEGRFAQPAAPPQPAAQPVHAPEPEPEPEPEPPQPDVILQELLLRLEECPTDTRTIRLVLWGQADLPAMRGALAHGLSLEQLALEAVDAVWRQLEQCLAAPRPANTSPLEWLAPSTKKALTAVRDALSPVVDLAAQAVTDKHGDGGVARARRERREIEERQRARRAAEGAAS